MGCLRRGEKDFAANRAGTEQKLSHVSGLAVDDKFAYVTTGGNLADQNAGLSGLRKIALDSGAVTNLDDGRVLPLSDNGGIALDEKFVYWNAGGKILRISKDGRKTKTIASENVGIGIDIAVDNEKVYWSNHGYYSPNSPTKPSQVYAAAKQGGKAEIFADEQKIPVHIVTDEKFVYWHTLNSILKKPKAGGQSQVVYQASNEENIDVMQQDGENLYFGFRGAGASVWALRKVSKNGGEPAKLDAGYSSGVIAQSKMLIYFAGLNDIYSFAK